RRGRRRRRREQERLTELGVFGEPYGGARLDAVEADVRYLITSGDVSHSSQPRRVCARCLDDRVWLARAWRLADDANRHVWTVRGSERIGQIKQRLAGRITAALDSGIRWRRRRRIEVHFPIEDVVIDDRLRRLARRGGAHRTAARF